MDTTAELFLPVSNSVFDLVVMYMRLANFVANLQNTVAPRLIAMSGRQSKCPFEIPSCYVFL